MTAGQTGPMHRALALLAAAALAAGLAACGGDDDAAPPTPVSAATTAAVTTDAAATTAPAPATALVPGTDGGDPLYPEPTTPPTEPLITMPAVSVTATTGAPAAPGTTDVAGPPSSEPLSVQELVLSGAGVGSALLGTDPDAVIAYVSSILGGNTDDTGWVAADAFGCPGSEIRRVEWGVLTLVFGDASATATGRRHFIAWEYGSVGGIGDEPVGLRTPGGVTLASRVVDVLGEFPEATLLEGDASLDLPDQFYVDDSFSGWLSGLTEDDIVTAMLGGYRCGG